MIAQEIHSPILMEDYTTVFDKPIDKTTLDNDNFGVNMTLTLKKVNYSKRAVYCPEWSFLNSNLLFPEIVRIAGNGKLRFLCRKLSIRPSGFNSDIIVGGINESAPSDTEGPEIQLFMNDESFIDGANTNTSPNLIYKVSR